MFALSSRDRLMPVVPMFHANCWALAFMAPMVGATLVMPGPKLDGASIYELLDAERVTLHGGGADDLADAAAASARRPGWSCRIWSASSSAARPARAP